MGLLNVPASTIAGWARISPTIFELYHGLRFVVNRKLRRGIFGPAVEDVPATLVVWVTEMHFAALLRAQEVGLDPAQCTLCCEAPADTALTNCAHQYFCEPCLRAWAAARGVLTCPL